MFESSWLVEHRSRHAGVLPLVIVGCLGRGVGDRVARMCRVREGHDRQLRPAGHLPGHMTRIFQKPPGQPFQLQLPAGLAG